MMPPASSDIYGTTEIRDTIRHGPMSRFQLAAVAICSFLNMIDGFDVLVMAFGSSSVAAEWRLSGRQLGVLLSAGLFGMTAGSLFLAPWADRFGRRAMVLVGLTTCSVGMLLSAFARNPIELSALRVVTGIGIGGMLASMNVITAEYASDRWRSAAVSLQATGYPVGATLGGSIAALLITHYGWRSLFVFGAFVSASMIPVVLWRLPESLDFLLDKRPHNAHAKLNALLRGMNRPEVPALPARELETRGGDLAKPGGSALRRLFAKGAVGSSMLIALSFFLQMFTLYFVLSWTPKLLVTAGLSREQGISGGVLLNVGGIVGGTLFSYLSGRFGSQHLTSSAMLLAAVTLGFCGFFARDLSLAYFFAVTVGAFNFAAMVGLFSMTPGLYPASIRATGMGWALGMGRVGAILSPLITGILVDCGWVGAKLYYAFAIPVIGAAIAMRAIRT
ncbi:MAG TPA: MFS transporter [Polyangiaceae bacterium]|nr:MFS transporter [Polyangiaceae bacterium]